MRYGIAILFFYLVGCGITKPLPPKPIIVIPIEDTINVVDRRINPTYISLDGTKSKIMHGDGKGFFKSWKWRQILGKRSYIDSANYIRANTTLKNSGKYAWELTGIDNVGNIGRDTFRYKNL